jgi:hypothetical protein
MVPLMVCCEYAYVYALSETNKRNKCSAFFMGREIRLRLLVAVFIIQFFFIVKDKQVLIRRIVIL